MDTIHILQKTYEQLYVARIPLLSYLSERLPVISSTWKRDCVERVLNERVDKDFSELDIYYLILVLTDYQNESKIIEIFPDDKLIYEDNHKLFNKIKDLRCSVMHPSFYVYTYENFTEWTILIESFVNVFDSSKNLRDYTIELHQKEKNRLLNIIKTEVLNPALNSPSLSEDIKQSVQNTLIRLEVQESAEGIIAFFTDALKAKQGKKVKEELDKNGLKSFEMIENKLYREYFC